MLVTFILVTAVVSFVVSPINLTGKVSDNAGMLFTLLTDSAGSRGFLLTLGLLLAVMVKLTGVNRQLLAQLLQLGVILVIGFAAKTGLKQMTESPRPYTEVLAHELLIPQPEHFYNLTTEQQTQVLKKVAEKVSPWRIQHWQGETDYSFPSGHTVFVAICLAFFGNILLQRKQYALSAVLLVWALSVAYSRLWLGMHRPVDLIGAASFIALVYMLTPTFEGISYKLQQRLVQLVE
nr:phosphatase PAP2 family protein [Vibrio hepatarius]